MPRAMRIDKGITIKLSLVAWVPPPMVKDAGRAERSKRLIKNLLDFNNPRIKNGKERSNNSPKPGTECLGSGSPNRKRNWGENAFRYSPIQEAEYERNLLFVSLSTISTLAQGVVRRSTTLSRMVRSLKIEI